MTEPADPPDPCRAPSHVEALFAACPDVLLMLDADGRILTANPAFLERFGKSREEVIGSCLYDLLPEAVTGTRRAALERAVNTRQTVSFDDERDGRAFETRVIPLREDTGEVSRLAVFTYEITRRRAVEKSLRESEARLRVITESLPLPLWVSRLSDGRILFANEGIHTILGLPPGALVGELTPDFYDDANDRANFLAELEAKGRIRHREVKIRLPDGRRRTIWASADLLELDGAQVMMGAFVDVTEQRELEAHMRQLQKTEAIGRLAGGIAHDFNNLLTAIDGHAAFLQDKLAESSDTSEDVREIRTACSRAAALARQLLAYGKRQVLQPRTVDLNGIVRDMENMLARLSGDQFTFEIRLAEPISPVRVDPSQMEQVLMNLVLNARDAMPNGGKIIVETAAIASGMGPDGPATDDPGWVRLSVIDHGVGMTAEIQSRIFEPFFTTKAADEGTGLGLATVQGIVHQSGGEIRFESDPGQGSRFDVFLRPDTSGAKPRAVAAVERVIPKRGEGTILLAEDDHAVRRLVQRVLEKHGFDVLAAETPQQALELAAAHGGAIALLLTDLNMPRMNGRELAEKVRQRRSGIRVLYMSGYDDTPGPKADDGETVLDKPFDGKGLLKALYRVLEH